MVDAETFGVGGWDMPDDFFNLPIERQAEFMGNRSGCPVSKELIEKDPDWIMKRYAETNYWFGYVVRQAWELNPKLAELLETPKERREDEPVGRFIEDCIPESHREEIAAMTGVEGYAIPRLLITIRGENGEQDQKRGLDMLYVLDKGLRKCDKPVDLMLFYANEARKRGVPMETIFSHMLSTGIMEEDNCRTTYLQVLAVMKTKYRKMWRGLKNVDQEVAAGNEFMTISEIENWKPKYINGTKVRD